MKTQRQRRGLSQQALADIVGVDRISINAWERGRRIPATHWICTLAAVLQCEPGDLFERTRRGAA